VERILALSSETAPQVALFSQDITIGIIPDWTYWKYNRIYKKGIFGARE